MSICDFCGKWVERNNEGDSLEPLLRALKFSDAKVQESLNSKVSCSIWMKGSNLITSYENDVNQKVITNFVVNGAWMVSKKKSHSKQLSRCSYDPTQKILLIEKKVYKNGGILRDERRVERDGDTILFRQRFEYTPTTKKEGDEIELAATIIVNRVWVRIDDWKDRLIDKFRGVWAVDEVNSESLRPIFEAMNIPKGSIRSALALKTLHSMYLSGPNELLLINQSQYGDVKTATHLVRELKNDEEGSARGKISCFASQPNRLILFSTSADGSSANKDERIISDDGLTFEQRICYTPLNLPPIQVTRKWKRDPTFPIPFMETLPKFDSRTHFQTVQEAKVEVNQSSSTKKEEFVSDIPPKLTSLSTPSISSSNSLSIVDIPSSAPSTAIPLSTTNMLFVNKIIKLIMTERYVALIVIVLILTILRLVLNDYILFPSGAALIFLLKYFHPSSEANKMEAATPAAFDFSWIRTSLLFFFATLSRFLKPEDPVLFLSFLVAVGISRFFATSRTVFMTSKSDQWIAVSCAGLIVTLIGGYSFPKILHGEEEDPVLGVTTVFAIIIFLGFRYYAHAYVPTPLPLLTGQVPERKKNKFSIKVTQYRQTENYAEYQIICQMSNGEKYEAWRRYSAFRAFRRNINRRDINLPSKRFFGSSSPSVMEERLKELNVFINSLVDSNQGENFIQTSHEARIFVGAPPV